MADRDVIERLGWAIENQGPTLPEDVRQREAERLGLVQDTGMGSSFGPASALEEGLSQRGLSGLSYGGVPAGFDPGEPGVIERLASYLGPGLDAEPAPEADRASLLRQRARGQQQRRRQQARKALGAKDEPDANLDAALREAQEAEEEVRRAAASAGVDFRAALAEAIEGPATGRPEDRRFDARRAAGVSPAESRRLKTEIEREIFAEESPRLSLAEQVAADEATLKAKSGKIPSQESRVMADELGIEGEYNPPGRELGPNSLKKIDPNYGRQPVADWRNRG